MLEYYCKKIRAVFISDESYRKKKHKKIFGTELSLAPPRTLNEKINYRMIYQHSDFFTMIADKITVRNYVELVISEQYIIPLLGIYDTPDAIDFDKLPAKFVMKCNHDSGSTLICLDKTKLSRRDIRRHFRRQLAKNPYYTNREWQYKNIIPRILIEPVIDIYEGRNKDTTPEMFRVHCFHGQPHFIEVDFTASDGREYVNVYNSEWKLQPFTMSFSNTPDPILQPETFLQILNLARKIAVDFDYCRIDFMSGIEKIYFSEITLTPESGQIKFNPRDWDAHTGKLWNL